MKVLIAHNEYGRYSGEEAVVDQMSGIIKNLGHEVVYLRKSTASDQNSLYGKLKVFVSGIWCPSGVRAMRKIIESEKPDIINVHNLYPFISPAALNECKKAGIPVIMTVHNFRLICPTGLFMRNGVPCEYCLDKGNEIGCVIHNCERSFVKSLAYASRNMLARLNQYYKNNVDYFACITDFQRKKLISAGFEASKIVVIPNSLDVTENKIFTVNCSSNYIGYCGRISEEKGIDLIISVARRHPEIEFRLAGEIRDKNITANLPRNISLVGYIAKDQLAGFIQNAKFMVMASKCYEGFPISILEAAKYAKPTIAPNHGGFMEIIGREDDAIGKLFTPNDIDDFERQVVELWNNPLEVHRLGSAAYNKLINEYSTEVISKKWRKLIALAASKKSNMR